MKTTTLNQIKSHGPCASGWQELLAGLGKTQADDAPLPYADILRINNINDALWAVRCAHPHDAIDLACRYAESVAHLTTDPRAAEAVRVARGVIAGTHSRADAAEAALAALAALAAEAAEAAWAEAAWAAAEAAEAAWAEAAWAAAAAAAWAEAAWAAAAAAEALEASGAIAATVFTQWANATSIASAP